MKKSVFYMIPILGIFAYVFFLGEGEQAKSQGLASSDWSELVALSLQLSESMDLPDSPPDLVTRVLETEPGTIDIHYSSELYIDGHQIERLLPYLGKVLTLETLIPLQASEKLRDYGVEKVFETVIDGNKVYICAFSDGQYQKIALFSANGRSLGALEEQYHRLSVSGKTIALLLEDRFRIYECTPTGFMALAEFPTEPVADYLQKTTPYAQKSGAFYCADFHFEYKDGLAVFWSFNVGTTAFLPSFLHLKFTYGSSSEIEGSPFGLATIADRLPVDSRSFVVGRINHRFWVPRSHDPQIDVFDLEGRLVKTVTLAPLSREGGPDLHLTSRNVRNLAGSEPELDLFKSQYRNLNFISGVHGAGDYVFITRANPQNPQYFRIFTLLNQNGDTLAEDFVSSDIALVGSGTRQVLSLFPFSPTGYLPQWMLSSKLLEPNMLRKHQGWWLLGFKVKSRAGYEENGKSHSKDDPLKEGNPSTDSQTLDTRLKGKLLRAKQLRNILSFDGFIRLQTPPEHGLKEITDALFLAGSYFIADRPGQQLLKFNRDGDFVRSIGRRGQGPGEFEDPMVLTRIYNDQFALSDRRAILLFAMDGSFVRSIEGLSEKGLTIGSNQLVWDREEHLYLADPFPAHPSNKQFALLTMAHGQLVEIKGFGERFHYFDKKLDPQIGKLGWTAFTKIGQRLWTGSPYNASIEIYDLAGNFIVSLEDSVHPDGVTFTDFEKLNARTKMDRFFRENRKRINHSLFPLGPIVIRTLVSFSDYPVYDIFDRDGKVWAKALNSGATGIEILDTHGRNMVAKLLGLDQMELTEDTLKKMLYRPEYEALFQTGFELGSEDQGHYLWLAHLPEK